MKLHVVSDIHLEFAPLDLPPVDADVLVLAGDIGVGAMGLRWAREHARGRPVLYVPGNHELYGSSFPSGVSALKQAARGSPVHVLDRDEVTLGGVRFLGAMLWTDFDALGEDARPRLMQEAADAMNDHHHVKRDGGGLLSPADTREDHLRSRAWLADRLATPHPGPTVVITHHAPVRAAFPRWAIKPAFLVASCVSRLEDLCGGTRAALWLYGHTHWRLDVRVRGTRVLSNPRGYPHRPTPGFDPGLVVEV